MISSIKLNGYRLLDGFQADLGSLTAVIGANAVGKSTLIDSLQFIQQLVEFTVNEVVGWHWGSGSLVTAGGGGGKLEWELTIKKPESAAWNWVSLERNSPLVYGVSLQTDTQGRACPQYEVLRKLVPNPGHVDPFKFLEATPFRRVILDKNHKLVPFDQAQPSQATGGEEPSADTPVEHGGLAATGSQPEAALLLSQIRFFNEFPVPSAVRFLLANMAFYPGFDVTRFSPLRVKAAEIKPFSTLSPNGDNLGTVLHEILTRYDFRTAAEELRELLSLAYPAFEEIHCDTTFGTPPQILVRVRERGMPRSMELWELSDGMLRFLCLATALLNPISPPMVAIDEPELGLHPRLLPIVGDMIKAATERTQVLITTHSPDLLNCFDLSQVAVMGRSDDGLRAIWHRPADRATLAKLLSEVTGETLGDLHRSGELEAGA